MQHNGRECIGVNSDYSLSAYKNQTFSTAESRTEFIRAMPRQEKVHAMNVFDSREQNRIYSGYAEARKGASNELFDSREQNRIYSSYAEARKDA